MTIQVLDLISKWAQDRNIIQGSTPQAQFVKLIEETGELAASIARKRDVKDDIGDILVVLNNIALQNGTTLLACAEVAYEDIKDRKGTMVDGVFIKEADQAGFVLTNETTIKAPEAVQPHVPKEKVNRTYKVGEVSADQKAQMDALKRVGNGGSGGEPTY